jgi:phosphate transport system permease protein
VTQLMDRPAGTGGASITPTPPPAVPPTPARRASPLRPRNFSATDIAILAVSAFSSFTFVWVVFYQLTLLSGAFGFLICWYACFLVLYWLVTAKLIERQVATDRVVTVIMTTGAAILIGLVLFIVLYVDFKAVPKIHWFALFTKTQKGFEPAEPNALGHVGVAHAIVGTLEEVGVAAIIGVPIAIATAVLLNEVRGWGTRFIRTIVTAMSGLPSIVAGLFIYSTFIISHWLGYSGFAAALALFVMLLPSVTRTTEEVLKVVPSGLREASLALGAPEWRTVWSVVLPTARSGVVTAVLLGIARIVGETAPLLFTAFGSQIMNTNVFSHPQEALPLVVWTNVREASPVLINLAYQAAFVLISLVLILFVAARIAGRTRGAKKRKAKSGGKAPAGVPQFPDDPTGLLAILGENAEMTRAREQREGAT